MEIFQFVMSQLQKGSLSEMVEKIGVSPDQAQKAVSGALPGLMSALENKSKVEVEDKDQGFMAFLDRNKDGSVLDDIQALVAKGGPNSGDVSGLVSSILGGKSDSLVSQLSQNANINPAQAGGLLSMITPLIMQSISKFQTEGKMDLSSLNALLGTQKEKAQEKAKESGMGGILDMLDTNKDGSVMDDAMNLLNKFMK